MNKPKKTLARKKRDIATKQYARGADAGVVEGLRIAHKVATNAGSYVVALEAIREQIRNRTRPVDPEPTDTTGPGAYRIDYPHGQQDHEG